MKLPLLLLLFIMPTVSFCQEKFTTVKTNTDNVRIPGKWEQLNSASDSGQTYLKNSEGVIIAVAQNPKKAYPFYKSKKTDFESVEMFYTWDSDFRKQNKFPTAKLKENAKEEYIIWKYSDGTADNIFLFGSIKNNFLNLLIYTNAWSEEVQVQFLEDVYELNK